MTLTGILESYEWRWNKDRQYVEERITLQMSGDTRSRVKKHKLDEEFPHKCHKCGKDLRFIELCAANMGKDKIYLQSLWELECVEFYCCTCYRKEGK